MTVGVLLMSYGTPDRPEDIETYYTHIRRGRAPTAEQLNDLQRRYQAIGGLSPLAARTRDQAEGVQRALDATDAGRFRVFRASKHVAPFLEDGVREVAAAGITRLVAMVLAPHYSALSVGEYLQRVEEAAGAVGLRVLAVRGWPTEPVLIDLLARRLARAMAEVGTAPADTLVLVSAHSLPRRVLELGDPYPDQLGATAAALARVAGVPRWRVAWQSAGRTPEPWLGPDILEELERARAEGAGAVVVCPAGFTSDHLEVLYDLDIEAKARAESLGLAFARTASLNADPAFCGLIAGLVRRAADS